MLNFSSFTVLVIVLVFMVVGLVLVLEIYFFVFENN